MEKSISNETMIKVQYHLLAVSKLLGLHRVVKPVNGKARGKGELAKAAGVSLETFNEWLSQEEVKSHLLSIGMTTGTRVFSPRAVEYICDIYGICLE